MDAFARFDESIKGLFVAYWESIKKLIGGMMDIKKWLAIIWLAFVVILIVIGMILSPPMRGAVVFIVGFGVTCVAVAYLIWMVFNKR